VTQVTIIGGGPGGYEAALVAAQLSAKVTVVDGGGIGGATVLTDCVPSKTLIATAEAITTTKDSGQLGVLLDGAAISSSRISADIRKVNERIKSLAAAQSEDIRKRLLDNSVEIISGKGQLLGSGEVAILGSHKQVIKSDVILIATGARPKQLPSALCDGQRILNWQQLYDLTELPEKLIVIGSGVTGAEFASAYRALGSEVVLISSRKQVLPAEDIDAAALIESVFQRRGLQVLASARARNVSAKDNQVFVELDSGEVITGSHALIAIGSIPNTEQLGLDVAGVKSLPNGFIEVDRVSRTSARNVYAAGDCSGVLPLASVAAMQGRIAMYHALGDAVSPLDLNTVSQNVFTDPEIASVGVSQELVDSGEIKARVLTLSLAGNARAKMQGQVDGLIKLFASPESSVVLGGVVVARNASELIFPITLAVEQRLNVDQLASTFTIYPSLTGSIAEAARQLHRVTDSAPTTKGI